MASYNALAQHVTNYNTLPKQVRSLLERKYNDIETELKTAIRELEASRDTMIAGLLPGLDPEVTYKALRAELDAVFAKINTTFDIDLGVYDRGYGFSRKDPNFVPAFRLTGAAEIAANRLREDCKTEEVNLRGAAKLRALALAKFAQSLVDQREALVIRQVKASFSTDQNAALDAI